ncbi:MAG: hypothetical protein HND53_08910 [Proteobacteria bacterium]|nr:hypothetical protein [Pseudomonadota bacterium]NOG60604.1 hypothetical protein [Pseudomonadota bacterium]
MQVTLLWAATFTSFVTFAIHTFVGGRRVAKPFLKDRSLPLASKWLNYYCWHITTVYTFSMGFAYAFVALNPDRPDLVVFLSVLNCALAILSVAVALKGNINPFRFPSTSLFASVSLFGVLSLFVS